MDTTRELRPSPSDLLRYVSATRRFAQTAAAGPAAGGARGSRSYNLAPGRGQDPTSATGLSPSFDLRSVSAHPMPRHVGGALLTEIGDDLGDGEFCRVVWQPAQASRIPSGRILLSWAPAGQQRTDVTALLGLPAGPALLATWPALTPGWSGVVLPTLLEVTALYAALRLAGDVLERMADCPHGC